MTHLHAAPLSSLAFSDMPTGVIPVLTVVVPEAVIPQDLAASLYARTQHKAALLAIEADLL